VPALGSIQARYRWGLRSARLRLFDHHHHTTILLGSRGMLASTALGTYADRQALHALVPARLAEPPRDARANDPSWTSPVWLTDRQLSVAFCVGYLQASLVPDHPATRWCVPRYLETVGNQLQRYVGHVMRDHLFELSPYAAEQLLLAYSRTHAVVRAWPVEQEAACRAAADYLRGLAALGVL
jgi:hypothetical protein